MSKKNYYPFNGEEKPETMEESLKAFEDYENDLEKSRPASADEIKKAFRELNKSKLVDEESKLRDHFAGLAMQSLLNNDQDSSFEVISADAYSIADCMLKARKEMEGNG